ncbi:integrase, partial [Streptomyces sp. NPDC127574]
RPGSPAVLRVGDRLRLDDRLHTVVGLSGTTVRLADEAGTASLVLLSHLLVADGFEFVDQNERPSPMPPFALLDVVPKPEAERAAAWERHVTEVEFGRPLDACADTAPRPEYDPTVRTLQEREAAKAAELTALGWKVSTVTVRRMRKRYREQGLWGLVDHRKTRLSSPGGRGGRGGAGRASE